MRHRPREKAGAFPTARGEFFPLYQTSARSGSGRRPGEKKYLIFFLFCGKNPAVSPLTRGKPPLRTGPARRKNILFSFFFVGKEIREPTPWRGGKTIVPHKPGARRLRVLRGTAREKKRELFQQRGENFSRFIRLQREAAPGAARAKKNISFSFFFVGKKSGS